MDLRRLRNFVVVAETENISRAARRAHLSQPALSRQMRSFEEELNLTLFERSGRALRLTRRGQELLDHARKALNEADAFMDRARSLRRGDSGVLRVGGTPQTLQRVFPPVLKRFKALAPGVDVRLREGHPAAFVEWLREGEVDLAFTAFQPELREGCLPAGSVPLFTLASERRFGKGKTVDLRALEGAPLILLARGFGSRDLFDAACQVAHVQPSILLESSAPATLLALARSGYGVAVLPGTVELPRGGFVIQRLTQGGRPLVARVAVHWDARRHLAPYGRRFAEELSKQARALYGASALTRRPVKLFQTARRDMGGPTTPTRRRYPRRTA